jgi:hypothetical protein
VRAKEFFKSPGSIFKICMYLYTPLYAVYEQTTVPQPAPWTIHAALTSKNDTLQIFSKIKLQDNFPAKNLKKNNTLYGCY